MDADPDADRDAVRPRLVGQGALGDDRGPDRARGGREHDEERIAGRALLAAALGLEGRPEELAVALAERGVAVRPDALFEPTRPLDVGEQERDGARRCRR